MTIDRCRICGNTNLANVIDLGDMAFSGIFPAANEIPKTGRLSLVRCEGGCGLVQLEDSFDPNAMYGENYGYRSGLNKSMVAHLAEIVDGVVASSQLADGDLVIDIGSNDGTTLGMYPSRVKRVGVDPTGAKFRQFYAEGITLIPDFFPTPRLNDVVGDQKAKIITSIAMFYDLESPLDFVRAVADRLDPGGVWITEQSYLPAMMRANAFDTICHEHLEYYALAQLDYVAEKCGLEVIGVRVDDTNGGSFLVVFAHKGAYAVEPRVIAMRRRETEIGLHLPYIYRAFEARVNASVSALADFLIKEAGEGSKIYGLGASTKGNIVLQTLARLVAFNPITKIGDVNPDKHGRRTPGTDIPIVSEDEALADNPDYLVVLPWHFKDFFLSSPKFKGRKLVFPLPQLDIIIP